jgi:hypothetical protein
MTDAHNLLLRALGQRIGSAHDLVLRESRLESWASATFQGMRHRYSTRSSSICRAISSPTSTPSSAAPGRAGRRS